MFHSKFLEYDGAEECGPDDNGFSTPKRSRPVGVKRGSKIKSAGKMRRITQIKKALGSSVRGLFRA